MQTDRKLMELAAKAARYSVRWHDHWGCFVHAKQINITNPPTLAGMRLVWAPLTDDGDALRLAVTLQLGISIPPVVDGRIEVVTFYGPVISIVEYPQNDDRQAATRRAIVRAASSIGEKL